MSRTHEWGTERRGPAITSNCMGAVKTMQLWSNYDDNRRNSSCAIDGVISDGETGLANILTNISRLHNRQISPGAFLGRWLVLEVASGARVGSAIIDEWEDAKKDKNIRRENINNPWKWWENVFDTLECQADRRTGTIQTHTHTHTPASSVFCESILLCKFYLLE